MIMRVIYAAGSTTWTAVQQSVYEYVFMLMYTCKCYHAATLLCILTVYVYLCVYVNISRLSCILLIVENLKLVPAKRNSVVIDRCLAMVVNTLPCRACGDLLMLIV